MTPNELAKMTSIASLICELISLTSTKPAAMFPKIYTDHDSQRLRIDCDFVTGAQMLILIGKHGDVAYAIYHPNTGTSGGMISDISFGAKQLADAIKEAAK